jgi:hypothetical protein
VDGFANAAFRFRGTGASPRAHGPDWLAVPDAPTAEAYVSLGWDPGRVGICGHPRWDEVRLSAKAMAARDRRAMRQRLFPLCAPERPVVLFAAEISEGLDPGQYRRSPAYTLEGGPGSQGRTEIVLDEFLDAAAALRPEPYLVLRLHPKQGPDSLVAYRAAFDQISSGGDPLEILYASDAVVGMTSMLLQEAALLGRATLSIVPREEEKAWLPTIAMGITPCASRRPEVREGLGRAVAGRRSEAALRFAAAGDSGCAGAVAAWLARIAEGRGRAPAGARTG